MAPKKGKKKVKKGKKSKKAEKKRAKELLVQEQAANDAELWDVQFRTLEETKNDFRLNAQELAIENSLLHDQMHQTETDTIDVVTYLKKADQKKDTKIERLGADIKERKRHHRLEKQKLIDDFNNQISTLEKKLSKKQEDIVLMQNELQHVKEFRKKRALMQKELDEIRDTMFYSNREHKEETSRLEQQFLEERISLQKEADQKISELGDRAHQEAMLNLEETTRTVYKENLSLSEHLSEVMKKEEMLKRINHRLREENSLLVAESSNTSALIADKDADSKRNGSKLAEANGKINLLEAALNHMIREFNTERRQLLNDCDKMHARTRQTISQLQQQVAEKSKECLRVRRLAKKILTDRTDIERFFLDSIELVRLQIDYNREEYKKAASKAYNRKMMEAFTGQGEFPKVRTFNKSEASTNSVFRDLEAAEMLARSSGQLDMSDLTWEQRERVLRYIFARINGTGKTAGQATRMRDGDSVLKSAKRLPIGINGKLAGTVLPDPYYDQADDSSPDTALNKHSVLPEIPAV